jgi:muconolactone delta-isomerase
MTAPGIYRANGISKLARLLADLPLAESLRTTITPLGLHPK